MARSWRIRIDDMLHAIDLIHELCREGGDSGRTKLTIERCFEIVSEASRYIPADLKTLHPEIRWQDLADLGNILRHVYHKVSIERLRETAKTDLPPLSQALLALKRHDRKP